MLQLGLKKCFRLNNCLPIHDQLRWIIALSFIQYMTVDSYAYTRAAQRDISTPTLFSITLSQSLANF